MKENTFTRGHYYRGVDVAFICFDLSDQRTLENVEKWNNTLMENTSSLSAKFLIGCKSDMKKDCSDTRIKEICEKIHAEYFETSAKEEAHAGLISLAQRMCFVSALAAKAQKVTTTIVTQTPPKPVNISVPQEQKGKKSCCK